MIKEKVHLFISLIVLCAINRTTCEIQAFLDYGDMDERSVVSCVLTISENTFSTGDVITAASGNKEKFVIQSINNEIANILSKTYKWSMYLQVATERMNLFDNRIKTDNYIIYFNVVDDISETLTFLKNSISWNPFARFIVTSHTLFEDPLLTVANITEIIWSFRILNSLIMLPTKLAASLDVLDIYTWYPYANGNCADKFTDTQLISQCQNGILSKNLVNLFPNKIPNKLNGCYVKARIVFAPPFVITSEDLDTSKTNLNITEGVEILLLNTAAEVSNFRVNYTMSSKQIDWGVIIENKTTVHSTGMFKLLINGEVDIGVGLIGATDITNKYLDYSISCIQDSMVWCVPQALTEPKWKCLFSIFHISTWALIFVTLFLTALLLWALSCKRPMEFIAYKTLQNCTINAFSVVLGISVSNQPRTSLSRIFFIIWIIFSLHLTICYQTSLISVLTRPSYEKQITTVEQLLESKISYGFTTRAVRYFENQNDWRSRTILKNWVECKDGIKCLKAIAYDRNYAFGTSRSAVRFFKNRLFHGKPLIYMFKENFIVIPLIMQLSKGFPLIHRLNKLLRRISESGFIVFWFKQLLGEPNIHINTNSGTPEKLSLYNVQAAFILLAFGLCVAKIVFALEFMYKYGRKIARSNNSNVTKK